MAFSATLQKNRLGLALAAGLSLFQLPLAALEYPIGVPEQRNGMEIAAVYLQPVRMEPEGMMRDTKDSDVHLEADIRALDININGFAEGEWIPYLKVTYEVSQPDKSFMVKGDFMPMVASDGPHYGDNVKLNGPGNYHVKFTIYPPSSTDNQHGSHFGRHTDRQTGVRPWFEAFSVEYDFAFAGIGKRGGY